MHEIHEITNNNEDSPSSDIGDLSRFWLSCSQRLLDYLDFQCFDRRKLFQKHVLCRGGSRISSYGAHLKKSRRAKGGAKILGYFVWKITILRQKIIFFLIAEGGAKIVGVFRVKNHDFTPKNVIFSNCGGRRENCWGISCEKSRFYAKKSYFF